MRRRQWLSRAAALGLVGSTPRWAAAQAAAPLQLVVPVPPGGSVDLTARLLAEHLPRVLKQNVIVENRPGASGSIAAASVARAAADPNLLMLVFDSHVTNPLVFPNLSYTLKDFTPISRLLSFPLVFAVPASLPVANVQEFIALAKKKPGSLNVSSAGLGTLNHLAAELFKARTATHIVHIPYRGGVPALQAVMNDEVQLFMGSWVRAREGAGGDFGEALFGRPGTADLAGIRCARLRCLHLDRRARAGGHRCRTPAGLARSGDAVAGAAGRAAGARSAGSRMGRLDAGRVRNLHGR